MTRQVIILYESLNFEQTDSSLPMDNRILRPIEHVKKRDVSTYYKFDRGKNGIEACYVTLEGERSALEQALQEYISEAGVPSYFLGGSDVSIARNALPENFSLRRKFPWFIPGLTAMQVYRKYSKN